MGAEEVYRIIIVGGDCHGGYVSVVFIGQYIECGREPVLIRTCVVHGLAGC